MTAQDAQRLQAHAPGKLEDWLELVPVREVDMVGEPETVIETDSGRRVLMLKFVHGGCVFLTERGCSVHPVGPRACRAYPFDRPTDQLVPLGRHPSALCPPETGIDTLSGLGVDHESTLSLEPGRAEGATTEDAKTERVQWRREVQSRDVELHRYAKRISVYNFRQSLRLRMGLGRNGSAHFLHWVTDVTPEEPT